MDLDKYNEERHIEDWFRPSVNASGTLLLKNFQSFVEDYNELKDPDKANVKEVYEANQNIADLCRGNNHPKRFNDISNPKFRKKLKDFFEDLWTRLGSQGGVNQQVTLLCGDILNHYQSWRSQAIHKAKLCPFCGLYGFPPSTSLHRPAYDHYLPKAKYPFVSVNFENLFPMCHDCNSYDKTTTDPLDDDGNHRIVFYPYDPLPEDHFEVRMVSDEPYNRSLLSTLMSDRLWHLNLLSEDHPDPRLNSWDKIFRISGRYREILEEYETDWFTDLKEEFRKSIPAKSFEEFRADYLNNIRRVFAKTERSVVRYAYAHFLLHDEGIEEDLRLLIVA
ncbi:MAG: hypothetical protein ACO1O6_11070 [Bacteroidota bacterium]